MQQLTQTEVEVAESAALATNFAYLVDIHHNRITRVDTRGYINTGVHTPIYRVVQDTRERLYWFRVNSFGLPIKLPRCSHTIYIAELQGVLSPIDLISRVTLDVTAEFLAVLANKPKIIRNQFGNAYIFGKLHPLYFFIGEHGNDIASTGIYDLTGVSVKKLPDEAKKMSEFTWPNHTTIESRAVLSQVRKVLPRVLFMGVTDGGDLGARVYVHVDSNRHIDSLIIDAGGLFVMDRANAGELTDAELRAVPMW